MLMRSVIGRARDVVRESKDPPFMDRTPMNCSIKDRVNASHRVIARRAQSHSLLVKQTVLDGKNRSRGPGRNADLVVDMLDVMPYGLGRDPE